VKAPKIAKKAVDGLSRFLQSRSKLVESPFSPRNQTWKQTFWTGTRKPNSYRFIATGEPGSFLMLTSLHAKMHVGYPSVTK
jgi:hypothetical protein